MTPPRQARGFVPEVLLRIGFVAALLAAFVIAIKMAWHWPFGGDSQVMHYVVFLMHHGFSPYIDIGDMNMPGAYLFEGWALAVFGASDLGWRLYDLSLALALLAAMVAIARRYDWIAGLAAGVVFTLVHQADGAGDAGQRDQVMAVLLILACAFLFESVRRHRPWLLLPFAFAAGMAASIKPTLLPVGPVLLVFALLKLRALSQPLQRYGLMAAGGFLLAIAVVANFLLSTHSAAAFFHSVTHVLPHYGGMQRQPLGLMVRQSIHWPLVFFLPFGLVAAVLRRSAQNWEELSLLFCAAAGAFSYFIQGKGFTQHRYTLVAFLLLWACLQLAQALQGRRLEQGIALAGALCLFLYPVRLELKRLPLFPQSDGFTDSLQSDLARIGTARLQHQVQCLDIINGCLTALYRLQIVQKTGATGDLGLFVPDIDPETQRERALFWSATVSDPPAVYVLSNEQFNATQMSFDRKLAAWPQFQAFLQDDYVLKEQWAYDSSGDIKFSYPAGAPPRDSATEAYRIYIRRGSPLLQPAGQPNP